MTPRIRKPELGRPADSRLTAEAIVADPRLTGVEPFDPARDIDLVDEINAVMGECCQSLSDRLAALESQTAQEYTIVAARTYHVRSF